MLKQSLLQHFGRAGLSGSFVARRWQSSFTFSSNKSLLQKDQLKNERRKKTTDKDTKTGSHGTSMDKTGTKRTSTLEIRAKGRRTADYSWLPKAPSTAHLKHRDVCTSVLYSGYRPFFLKPEDQKQNDSTLYEFAMKLEGLGDPLPWISSATGTEFFGEWDGVPADVIKKLKPYQPPAQNLVDKDREARKLLHQEHVEQEKQKLINRSKGRKKPILRLLQLNKKFDDQDGD
ncbi:LANO_0H15940g1_1 [Lachancea nothofagi CBS 11611]|uniref:LANO_0H15940g1_1 n=1 Tax=Lachancea nothofagi CBS 11611 TaxID=1266666 RepID=A0A1G4KMW0_9SACH|nr:LANO_0H15940g1_1 [Lachancea nothofagi CBS 11611]